MDFFKTVLSDKPSASSSSSSQPDDQNSDINIPSVTNAWAFGSILLKSIASKSESVIENYKREFNDFSSGLRKETDIVRQAARRAVNDLPARLESGAAVAQSSLESVGQVIDNIGSTVSIIITHGKDSIFNPIVDEDSDAEIVENNDSPPDAKPYNRIDALIRALQCDMKTYCDEPEEAGEYEEWKKGFVLEEQSGEIQDLVKENGVTGEIYNVVVPGQVDSGAFWSRYFFRIYLLRRAEEARAKLVKRAIEREGEEELSWDVDDNIEEKVDNLKLRDGGVEEECDSEMNCDGVTERRSNESESHGEEVGISDFSVISSQRSSTHEEEDLGWDEIEDIESGDDGKAASRTSPILANLQRQSTAAEEDEDLTWDIQEDE